MELQDESGGGGSVKVNHLTNVGAADKRSGACAAQDNTTEVLIRLKCANCFRELECQIGVDHIQVSWMVNRESGDVPGGWHGFQFAADLWLSGGRHRLSFTDIVQQILWIESCGPGLHPVGEGEARVLKSKGVSG